MFSMLHQIVPFVMKHWVLIIAFIAVAIVIAIEEIRSQNAGGQRVTSMMATRFINHEDAVLVDIRDISVFREGHIVNAKNFPVADLDRQQEKLMAYRDRILILADATGIKLLPFSVKLKTAGITKPIY